MTVRPASQASTPAAGRLATDPAAARTDRGRQGRTAETCPRMHAGARPPADRGHPGRRQIARWRRRWPPTLGLKYSRIQFTSDLLPADVLGVSIYDERTRVVSASTPGRSSVPWCSPTRSTARRPRRRARCSKPWKSGRSRRTGRRAGCPIPFFVIATQNPVEQIGAYPLPESQLDRFLMAIELRYPDPAAERDLLVSGDRRARIADTPPAADAATLADWQREAAEIHVAPRLARLRAGADRRLARPRRPTAPSGGSRGPPRAEPACRPHAARRSARMGDDRRAARWCCPRMSRRCFPRSRAIAWPGARAPERCRRRRSCAQSCCRSGISTMRASRNHRRRQRFLGRRMDRPRAATRFRVAPADHEPVVLRHSRIYILPTRRGWALLATVAMMLVTSLNYALVAGGRRHLSARRDFLPPPCCTRSATWRGSRMTPLSAGGVLCRRPRRIHAVAAWRRARAQRSDALGWKRPRQRRRSGGCGIDRHARGRARRRADASHLGRVTLSSAFPLGLWRGWAYVHFRSPASSTRRSRSARRRCRTARRAPTALAAGRSEDADLTGLREFQRGDPPQRVAWKAVARGAGWFTKEFDGIGGGGPVTLSWTATSRNWQPMRRACPGSPPGSWLPSAPARPFALSFPAPAWPADKGREHRRKALVALALFPEEAAP